MPSTMRDHGPDILLSSRTRDDYLCFPLSQRDARVMAPYCTGCRNADHGLDLRLPVRERAVVELLGALAVPVGKLLLKYGISPDTADVGGSLFQLAFKQLGERQKVTEAEAKARAVGDAVVADLGQALRVERGKEHDL